MSDVHVQHSTAWGNFLKDLYILKPIYLKFCKYCIFLDWHQLRKNLFLKRKILNKISIRNPIIWPTWNHVLNKFWRWSSIEYYEVILYQNFLNYGLWLVDLVMNYGLNLNFNRFLKCFRLHDQYKSTWKYHWKLKQSSKKLLSS